MTLLHHHHPLLLTILMATPLALAGAAEPALAPLFTDHAILQRNRPVPVWGTADPGAGLVVLFAGQAKPARADADGRWRVRLDPMPASAEPRDLVVRPDAGQPPLALHDVLVGDVWLCSGQSNMGMPVRESAHAEQEIPAAQHPDMRLFTVSQRPSPTPLDAVVGRWEPCSPQTVAGFSATAYFFGRELDRELHIPIGLLHSSVGGTPAEAWTRLAALETVPAFADQAHQELARWRSQAEDNARFPEARAAWENRHGVERPANTGLAQGWADAALDTSGWKTVTLPHTWEQLGQPTGGVFWVRKEAVLPEEVAGKPFRLSLLWLSGQYDTVYFNGTEIGHGGDTPPEFDLVQRNYQVPGNLVRSGRNVIAVRIVSASAGNGFWTWGKSLGLPGVDPRSVDDRWLFRQESAFPALPAEALATRPKPNGLAARCVSSALFNGMIAPLVPFAITGAIWYQGESNVPRAERYRELLTLMISDWRTQWGQGDFPFLIQQLVNHNDPASDANARSGWARIREAQVQVAASMPQVGVAVGIELGEALNIHPKNKQEVGRRLALVALEKTYGRAIESSGPRFAAMTAAGAMIRVQFTHADGLMARGGTLQGFAIAGADRTFVWADAAIDGATVVVRSPQVAQPVAVRYAWADNPAGCNLVNAAGLPAAPFRTDTDGP